ncbi:MAG: flavin reductase family protein [Candidatus Caldarchaeum sp.]
MPAFEKVVGERVHRLFYPQIPAVVTASHGDEVGGLLATSVIPVSINPPMIGVALGKNHRTTRLVETSKCFGVCWLSYEAVDRLAKLALPVALDVKDKLRECGFSYGWGRNVHVPVLDEAAAWAECVVNWSREVGDHVFYAGRVEAAYAIGDFGEYWSYRRYKPVFYVGGARAEWPKYVRFPFE